MRLDTDEPIASRALSRRQTDLHIVSRGSQQETTMEHEPPVTLSLHTRDPRGRIPAQRLQQ
jgi:hypothetical protein